MRPGWKDQIDDVGARRGVGRREFIQATAELLRTSSTVVLEATKAGTLAVAAGVYDVATGQVPLAS